MAVENWQMPAIGAGAAFLGSIPQMVEARRLRKERERLLAEGAPGLTPIEQQQIAEARGRAASTLAPGYAQEMEGIAQQQADVLAAGKRGSQTSSNLLNLLSRMNAQGQAARRNLAMRGAQAQRQARGELTSLSMSADARRENRMRRWEDDMAAMDAARRQYNAQAGMAPVQGAIAFMPTEGLKFTKKPAVTPESVKFNPETDVSYGDEMNVTGGRMAVLNPTPEMTGLGGQLNMTEDIGYNPFTHLDPRGKIAKLGVQIPQGRPPMVSTIPNITQQGFYSNPYSKFGGDNSRFTYNPDGTVEVLGSKGQRSKGNYKVDRNGRPQIFNLD